MEAFLLSLLGHKGEMGEWEEGVGEGAYTLGGHSVVEKSKTFCRVENVKSGLFAVALGLPKVSSHSESLIF